MITPGIFFSFYGADIKKCPNQISPYDLSHLIAVAHKKTLKATLKGSKVTNKSFHSINGGDKERNWSV